MSREFLTPFDEINTANNVLRNTRQTEALCEYRPHELLRLALACIASDWDVTPDELDESQRRDILTGRFDVPDFIETRRGLEPNGCKDLKKGERAKPLGFKPSIFPNDAAMRTIGLASKAALVDLVVDLLRRNAGKGDLNGRVLARAFVEAMEPVSYARGEVTPRGEH